MNETIRMEISTDEEGFFSNECPYCGGRFKLSVDDIDEQNALEIFCPMCGLRANQRELLTREQIAVALDIAENFAVEQIDEMFRDLEKSFRGSRHVTLKRGRDLGKKPARVLREIADLAVATLNCCDVRVKVPFSIAVSIIYCPYCGNIQE